MMATTEKLRARVTLPTSTQILITRDFDAPRHLVFRAMTTPALIERWWHAKRGKVTVAQVDLRVGGKWRYVMIAEGGFEVAFHGVYREVVPDQRLVYSEVYEGIPNGDDDPALVTMTLVETNGRTTLTELVEMSSQEGRDAIIASGMEGGMQDALELLEEVARSLRPQGPRSR
jgi:uncharacterized protein YndB with AHSA1/START domain